jgi:hypothetical protein
MRQFNAEELKALAAGLAPVLIPMLGPPAINPPKVDDAIDEDELQPGTAVVDGKVVYTDPAVKVADETINRAMKALPTGTATYVGRRGTTQINHSKETIDAIESWKKKRHQWGTRTNI